MFSGRGTSPSFAYGAVQSPRVGRGPAGSKAGLTGRTEQRVRTEFEVERANPLPQVQRVAVASCLALLSGSEAGSAPSLQLLGLEVTSCNCLQPQGLQLGFPSVV